MTVRLAAVVAFVSLLAYPLAAPASEVVGESAAKGANSAEQPLGTARRTAATERPSANPYAEISNEQLADLADRWEALTQDERRWFFVEVRRRLMATDGAPAISLGASARFGQVVRNRDGTVARIETTPVTAKPATADVRDDPRAYGLGFERRVEVQGGREGRPTPASVRLPASAHQRPGKPDGGT